MEDDAAADADDLIDMLSSSFISSRDQLWWFIARVLVGSSAPPTARKSRELAHFRDCINIILVLDLDDDDNFSSLERLVVLFFLGDNGSCSSFSWISCEMILWSCRIVPVLVWWLLSMKSPASRSFLIQEFTSGGLDLRVFVVVAG